MRKKHDAPPIPDEREALEPLPPYPQLDLEKYRPMLDGYDMTEAQKDEHLKAVWHIMTAFVDKAFDGTLAPLDDELCKKASSGD